MRKNKQENSWKPKTFRKKIGFFQKKLAHLYDYFEKLDDFSKSLTYFKKDFFKIKINRRKSKWWKNCQIQWQKEEKNWKQAGTFHWFIVFQVQFFSISFINFLASFFWNIGFLSFFLLLCLIITINVSFMEVSMKKKAYVITNLVFDFEADYEKDYQVCKGQI